MKIFSRSDVHDIWARFVQPEHLVWTWRMLGDLYGGSERYYHQLDHIGACLSELESMPDPGGLNLQVVTLALIWHDAVYVPGDSLNEQLSASLLRSLTPAITVKSRIVDWACNAILVTQHHDGEALGDNTIAAVVDIDLSILGTDSATYDRYAQAVRREFAHVSDEAWRHGRSTFLAGMLARNGPIFTLASMRDRYEMKARENMQREHDALVSQ